MNMEAKEFLRNENVDVRRSAASNPNSEGYKPIKYEFIVTKTYVATNGTNHIWYKHKLSQYRAVLYLWMFLRFP